MKAFKLLPGSSSTGTLVPLPTITVGPVPPISTETIIAHIGKAGHIAQWVAVAVFILTAILLGIHSTLVHRKSRTFHYVTALLAALSALAYYGLATHTAHPRLLFFGIHDGSDAFHKIAKYRVVYPEQFVGWFAIGPLVLLNPLLLSGVSWVDVWATLAVIELAAGSALMAAVTRKSPAMWGWFAFLLVFLCFILYIFFYRGVIAARRHHEHITRLYLFFIISTFVLIIPYIVIFILGHGANIINPNIEALIFVVFDIVLRSLLPTLLIIAYDRREHVDHGPTMPEYWFEHRNAEGAVRLQED